MSIRGVEELLTELRHLPDMPDDRARHALVSALLDVITRLARQPPLENRLRLTGDREFWLLFSDLQRQSVDDKLCAGKALLAMQSLCESGREMWSIRSTDEVRRAAAVVEREKHILVSELCREKIYLGAVSTVEEYVTRNEQKTVYDLYYATKCGESGMWQQLLGLADRGECPLAAGYVALVYHVGAGSVGVKKDKTLSSRYAQESLSWLKTRSTDSTYAQTVLGFFYSEGIAVAKDDVRAAELWQPAAGAGHAPAQVLLGLFHSCGRGVELNQDAALRLYRLAADQGYAIGQFAMGTCYVDGIVVDQSYEEAMRWFRLAADQGDGRAQVNVGAGYMTGRGVDMDEAEGVRWYRRAAEQGNMDGQFYLANCYSDGKGVGQDEEEAMRWYRMAADQGHEDSRPKLLSLQFQKWFSWLRVV